VALDRRLGWLAVLAGMAMAFVIQLATPIGVPLYDGVAVQEPYRYLHPTGDQPGDPSSYSASPAVVGGVSPFIAAATKENPPQAQLIAQRDAFRISPGAVALQVSVTPVEPPPPAADGTIVGNVYRFSVTDEGGNPLAIKGCEGCLSLALRAPDNVVEATIRRFANGVWSDVQTAHAGIVAMYQTNATILGDYAVVAGPKTTPGGGPDLFVIVGAAAVLLLIVGGAILFLRVRPAPAAPADRPRRVPSKRRAPRKPPPSRRSDR
jgi:hypothetical protein